MVQFDLARLDLASERMDRVKRSARNQPTRGLNFYLLWKGTTMTAKLGSSRSGRHAAIVDYLMGIPIDDIREMLTHPDDLEQSVRERVPGFAFGEFVVALKEVADRQQHEVQSLAPKRRFPQRAQGI